MSKRILITGAAGYIGHQLGNRLAQDFHVIGTDLRSRDDVNFPLQIMDIRDHELGALMKQNGITHVVQCAARLHRGWRATPDRHQLRRRLWLLRR